MKQENASHSWVSLLILVLLSNVLGALNSSLDILSLSSDRSMLSLMLSFLVEGCECSPSLFTTDLSRESFSFCR